MLSTISFSKTALLIRENVIEKVDILPNTHYSKIFDKVSRLLTGLKFSFIFFLPLLCKGVMSANFKKEGKPVDLIALLMFKHKNSLSISISFLIILVGI